MTPAERGKRIKEARLAKKMTQSEVVGDFITRNMLSQIESGTATPSVKTLEYLAQVLDIPISGLMPGNDDNDGFSYISPILSKFLTAKEYYLSNEFKSCISELKSAENTGSLTDEYQALLALAYLGLAKKFADEENLVKAVEYAKLSADTSDIGIYANKSLKNDAISLRNSLAKSLSDYYAGLVAD